MPLAACLFLLPLFAQETPTEKLAAKAVLQKLSVHEKSINLTKV